VTQNSESGRTGVPNAYRKQGDWYARNMYMQGSAHYEFHVKHYGHPSQFGHKDICNLWKAERWQPETPVDLYKRRRSRVPCLAPDAGR